MVVDIETIVVSSVIGAVFSAIVALIIAGLVYYKLKPPSEKNFEDNRKSESKWLFSVLELYHKNAIRIFDAFEDAFDELGKKRKELVTKSELVSLGKNSTVVLFADIMRDKQKMDDLKDRYSWNLDHMRKYPVDYGQPRNVDTLREFFSHSDFILPIFSMIKNINDYTEGLFQAELRPYSLLWAIKNSEIIIKYLKDHKFYKDDENANAFIVRWEDAIKEHLK